MQPLLELKSIKRSFGAIDALRGVDFEINAGEVMGLVGENGAGKSTLVKIISGFDAGYTGDYLFNGKPVEFSNAVGAERAGIAIAQQELSLIPTMSVAENIFLVGHNVPLFATKRSLAKKAKAFLEQVGLDDIDPSVGVDRLSVGEQHLVEVARLIAHDPSVLILDEPTAALGLTVFEFWIWSSGWRPMENPSSTSVIAWTKYLKSPIELLCLETVVASLQDQPPNWMCILWSA
jgi:ribose transport system ATP-binding protein